MKMFVVLVLCLVIVPVVVAQAEEKDGFDDWYGMLEFQGGTTWDFKTACARLYGAGKVGGYKALTGVLGAEFDIDEDTEAEGVVAALAGVTYNLGNLKSWGVDISWAEYIGVNVGAGVTYDWIDNAWGWRGMLSIVDLSFSDGNASRQKKR